MDNLKFRAFDHAYNVMVYRTDWASCIDGWIKAPDVFDVMQCTGLKDKNGTEIYDGDILASILEDGYNASIEDGWGLTACYWKTDEARFDFSSWSPTEEGSSVFCWRYVEVVGNIYDNPELLDATAS